MGFGNRSVWAFTLGGRHHENGSEVRLPAVVVTRPADNQWLRDDRPEHGAIC